MRRVWLALVLTLPGCAQPSQKLLYADDFRNGLGLWSVEAEKPGKVSAQNGVLDIDVPAGVTLWFRSRLDGPLTITYEATVISAGGPHDRVSDLNCFWMATDPAAPDNILAHPRSGAFAAYNSLRTYYVGLGGNGNTTTRFRRYVGDETLRPLLPENDLTAADRMIVANRTQTLRLVANSQAIEYYRDKVRIFRYVDTEPYERGWFALRTTDNHMQIRKFRVWSLPAPARSR